MQYKITILGCGGSAGVPSIENGWGSCNPNNPKNYRTRTSMFLEVLNHNILFDVGPDFRTQALLNNIKKIDSLLFTHPHADHIYGLDDIRSINRTMNKAIDTYLSKETYETLQKAFHYIFLTNDNKLNHDTFYKPVLNFNVVDYFDNFTLNNGKISIKTTKHNHGRIDTMGYVIDGRIGYATDFVTMDSKSIEAYKNLDLLIISAFTKNPHICHMTLEEVISLVQNQLKPKQAILTHMGVGLDYEEISNILPSNIKMGFDGLVVVV
jgi:phosphoribosyl 1,2-cyclic phosphate phosphodiesterase